jgi:hypothetical protein
MRGFFFIKGSNICSTGKPDADIITGNGFPLKEFPDSFHY